MAIVYTTYNICLERELNWLSNSVEIVLNVLRRHWRTAAVIAIITIIGFCLTPVFRFQINPDGISYITIAQKYASGHFRPAINGYWGPLFSWLITPAFWLKADPILYIKILQVGVATGLAIVSSIFVYRLTRNYYLEMLVTTIIGILGLEWALVGPLTPDLLVCLLSLVLAGLLVRFLDKPTILLQVLIGMTGAGLYFAKSVGFYLFFGLLALTYTYSLFISAKARRRRLRLSHLFTLAKPYWLAIGTFITISLPFIVAISLKYNRPTIGTSGSYNFALIGPQTIGHPMLTQGLMEPPNEGAQSVWEDISRAHVREWSPLESGANFKHLLKTIHSNINSFRAYLLPFAIPFLTIAVLYAIWPNRDRRELSTKTIYGGLAALTIAAYLPILVEFRYIHALVVIGILYYMVFLSYSFKYRMVAVSIAGIVACFFLSLGTIRHIGAHYYLNREFYEESERLKPWLGPGNRVAASNFGTVYACYYTGADCYGVIIPQMADAHEQLARFKIDRLLINQPMAEYLLSKNINIKPVPGATFSGLSLYEVNGL